MTKRRHRNPWPVTTAQAWTLEPGAVVVVGGFDYVVAGVDRLGLPLAPDGDGAEVVATLAHPVKRRGRPRAFDPPALDLLATDEVELRAGDAPTDWTRF
jgi:hypothetical protein